ncbi:chemotaxis response regulator protein-glutamate methylesterase [Marispirochaeta sp.]|uniref:protein-glutamate methylesterase/protein-glutamine glutaminase n=1 Tax=Marispirochaeta sp. TaxID=2038653 RepID=UPI0029C6F2E8|nr:chemotaxis response regulator protein-glutamate methylesterase [Marispirochaeta sp.]
MTENLPLGVLICDDSALMRNLISRIIDGAEGLTVVGKAMNGKFALQKIPLLKPDLILLDIEMPEMNGIEFLKERRRQGIKVPVVILSSLARRGAQITMEALNLGASDFILKPSGSISEDIHVVSDQIVTTVRAYGAQYRRHTGNVPLLPDTAESVTRALVPPRHEEIIPPLREIREKRIVDFSLPRPRHERQLPSGIDLLAIGISTGGPNALRKVFAAMERNLPVPVVVVQHMPAGFTGEFARSLDRISGLEVKEAEEGDLLNPGRVLITPGNRHIEVEKRSLSGIVHLTENEPVNGHRPSADVLFKSVAAEYGNRAVAVIMTGMGRDGAREIGTIQRMGGVTIAQDAESCIVYGMPKVAIDHGYIDHVVKLQDMADTIGRLVRSPSYGG